MRKRYRQMNWFYIPALILMLMFVAYPFAQTISISLMRWNRIWESSKIYWPGKLHQYVFR